MKELTNTRLYKDACSIIEHGRCEVMLFIPKAAVGVDDK